MKYSTRSSLMLFSLILLLGIICTLFEITDLQPIIDKKKFAGQYYVEHYEGAGFTILQNISPVYWTMINLTILSHYIRFRKPRGRYVTIVWMENNDIERIYLHRSFWEIAIILCLIPYFILSAIIGMVEAVKLMALGIFLLTLLIIGVWFCIFMLISADEGGGGGGHHRMVYNHTTGKIEHHILVGRIPQEKKKQ